MEMTEIRNLLFFLLSVLALSGGPILAQQALPTLEACTDSTISLDEQILVCEALLNSDLSSDVEKAYLLPIIAELRGEAGDFEAAYETASIAGAELLLAMGDAQFEAKRHELAMIFFVAAKTGYVDDELVLTEVKSFLDNIHEILGLNHSGLISVLDVGLENRPGDSNLLARRAEAFARNGDITRAFEDWDAALGNALYPHMLQLQRARVLWDLKLVDEALAALSVLVDELKPGGRHERLIEERRSVVTGYFVGENERRLAWLSNDQRNAFILMTRINREIGEYDAALTAVTAWLRQFPTDLLALTEKAQILASMGRNGRAWSAFDASIDQARQLDGSDVGSNSVLAFLARGRFHATHQRVELAMSDFDVALGQFETDRMIQVQELLEQLDVFKDTIDGVYDEGTRQAIAQCIREPACDLG